MPDDIRKYIPLNSDEIQAKVMCKFMPYSQLYRCNSIEALLPKTLILYETKPKMGHFCCVFINSEGINFFDPYGIFPDDELNKINNQRRRETHQEFAYLDRLLLEGKSSHSIIYNEYVYQSVGTSTCGKWCCVRLLYSDLHNDEFHDCFKGIKKELDIVICDIYDNL